MATRELGSDSADGAGPRGESKTLNNGIRILKVIAAHPRGLGVTDLARAVGVHRTVAYRLLGTLERHGLVAQDDDGRYRLGLAVVELSAAARSDLGSAAHEALGRLADSTGATAVLSQLDGDDVVCCFVVEPGTSQPHVAYRVGLRSPGADSEHGLAILSGRPYQDGEAPAVTAGRESGYVAQPEGSDRAPWGLAAPIPRPSGFSDMSVGLVALEPLPLGQTAALVIATAAKVGERLALLGPVNRGVGRN